MLEGPSLHQVGDRAQGTRYHAWRAWAGTPAGHRWLLREAQCPYKMSCICCHCPQGTPLRAQVLLRRGQSGADEEDGPRFRLAVLPLSVASKPDGSFHLPLPQLPHRPSRHAGSRFQRSLPRPRPGQLGSSCCQPRFVGANGGVFDLVSSHGDDGGDAGPSHGRCRLAADGFSHTPPQPGRPSEVTVLAAVCKVGRSRERPFSLGTGPAHPPAAPGCSARPRGIPALCMDPHSAVCTLRCLGTPVLPFVNSIS